MAYQLSITTLKIHRANNSKSELFLHFNHGMNMFQILVLCEHKDVPVQAVRRYAN